MVAVVVVVVESSNSVLSSYCAVARCENELISFILFFWAVTGVEFLISATTHICHTIFHYGGCRSTFSNHRFRKVSLRRTAISDSFTSGLTTVIYDCRTELLITFVFIRQATIRKYLSLLLIDDPIVKITAPTGNCHYRY